MQTTAPQVSPLNKEECELLAMMDIALSQSDGSGFRDAVYGFGFGLTLVCIVGILDWVSGARQLFSWVEPWKVDPSLAAFALLGIPGTAVSLLWWLVRLPERRRRRNLVLTLAERPDIIVAVQHLDAIVQLFGPVGDFRGLLYYRDYGAPRIRKLAHDVFPQLEHHR